MGKKQKQTAVNGKMSINKLKQCVIHFTDAAQWINNKMEVLNCLSQTLSQDLRGMAGRENGMKRGKVGAHTSDWQPF